MDLILKGSHLPCHEADEEGLKAKNKVCQEPAFVLEGSQCSVEFQQWLLGDKTEKPSPDEEHEARPHDGILLSQEEELSSPQSVLGEITGTFQDLSCKEGQCHIVSHGDKKCLDLRGSSDTCIFRWKSTQAAFLVLPCLTL
ncbi:uncharacterized protein LOC116665817 isoform X7 [Camelus ferus]|uniref:Uncharacterized protein LOC116665817 isoform X7 n=1 Tax=Camelus ferus TaxID=419612 RepID=A0A8B8TKD8_CAMFR|nr:uncharacterized protein LOC116665817 isoform X7 [Camelus ferus]